MRDIVIIGGGVAGMAIAWEAQKNGHSVLLLEKDACGGGASQASAGILSPAGKSCGDPELNRFIWQGIRMFPDWIKELRKVHDSDPDLQMEGVLYPEEPELKTRIASLRDVDVSYQVLEKNEIKNNFPWFDVEKAVLIEDEGRINPRKLMYLLKDALLKSGVEIRENTEVLKISKHEENWKIFLKSNKSILASKVAMCTGAWAQGVEDWIPPIKPMRGQIIELSGKGVEFPTHTVHGAASYMVPQSGHYWIGGIVQDRGFDDSIDKKTLFQKVAIMAKWVPIFTKAKLGESWCGFRPGSPDERPIIGERKGLEGIFWATGLFRNGVSLSPAVAKNFISWINGSFNPDPEYPFSPNRFL